MLRGCVCGCPVYFISPELKLCTAKRLQGWLLSSFELIHSDSWWQRTTNSRTATFSMFVWILILLMSPNFSTRAINVFAVDGFLECGSSLFFALSCFFYYLVIFLLFSLVFLANSVKGLLEITKVYWHLNTFRTFPNFAHFTGVCFYYLLFYLIRFCKNVFKHIVSLFLGTQGKSFVLCVVRPKLKLIRSPFLDTSGRRWLTSHSYFSSSFKFSVIFSDYKSSDA